MPSDFWTDYAPPSGFTTGPDGTMYDANGNPIPDTGPGGVAGRTGDGSFGQTGSSNSQLESQVAGLYQQLLGRPPENPGVVQAWINGTGGNLDAIRQGIATSGEAKAYIASGMQPKPNPDTPASNNGLPASGRTMDDAAIKAQIAKWAAMPGADPSLANDPDYWTRRIKETGGLGADNSQYWQDAGVGPTAFFRNPQRESGGGYASLSNIGNGPGYTPTAPYTPPTAPTFTPISVSPFQAQTMAMPKEITMPTAAEVEATPGYQFTRDQGLKAAQQSAIAKGQGLGGGTLRELEQYGTGLADSYYGEAANRALNFGQTNFSNQFNVNQANNANALNAYQASTNAALAGAGLNLQGTGQQFQQTYLPSWNAYQSDVQQNQFGAGLANNNWQFGANYGLNSRQLDLAAQNQFWNQGFNENINAYNQYRGNQNDAFNQWLALANLGHPGNPYT